MTLDKRFYPGLNKVLVSKKEQAVETTDNSGLILSSKSSVAYCTIEAIGTIKDSKDIDASTYQVGDNVYILPQSGMTIELDGSSYRLINVTEILVGERHD